MHADHQPLDNKKDHPTEKVRLHPRNKHRERYDFEKLTKVFPPLLPLVSKNRYGDESIDFADPKAVKALNTSLLMAYYDMENWDIPNDYLCPPIQGRADYIHYCADLLAQKNFGKFPPGDKINCLDIGIGANCIYPVIGVKEYGWSFVGSEIDEIAIKAARQIIDSNKVLKNKVDIRHQPKKYKIFKGIIREHEYFDLTICNPPFHGSAEEAMNQSQRKLKNLKLAKPGKPLLNFGGQQQELWCEGGEDGFVQQMIAESFQYSHQCLWFTTLISKQSNLKRAYQALDRIGVYEFKTIPMGQGNKTSRVVAWTFLTDLEQKKWVTERWSVKS